MDDGDIGAGFSLPTSMEIRRNEVDSRLIIFIPKTENKFRWKYICNPMTLPIP